MKTTELGLAVAGLVLSTLPVVAHHSFAMFDRSHTMTLEERSENSSGATHMPRSCWR